MHEDIENDKHMVEKIRAHKWYAQNLYAAMSNMRWQKLNVIDILTDEYWSATWRSAGGIVARIRGNGEDYLNYYCSGIREVDYDEEVNKEWDEKKYVAEGDVTDEIRADLLKLGWVPSPWPDEAH
jgi:hypothetical protein